MTYAPSAWFDMSMVSNMVLKSQYSQKNNRLPAAYGQSNRG